MNLLKDFFHRNRTRWRSGTNPRVWLTKRKQQRKRVIFFLLQTCSLPFKVMHLFLFLDVLFDSLPINVWKKIVLKVDDSSIYGAGCHPPPFLLEDACSIPSVFNNFSTTWNLDMIASSLDSLLNGFVLAKQTKWY